MFTFKLFEPIVKHSVNEYFETLKGAATNNSEIIRKKSYFKYTLFSGVIEEILILNSFGKS